MQVRRLKHYPSRRINVKDRIQKEAIVSRRENYVGTDDRKCFLAGLHKISKDYERKRF